MVPVFVTANFL